MQTGWGLWQTFSICKFSTRSLERLRAVRQLAVLIVLGLECACSSNYTTVAAAAQMEPVPWSTLETANLNGRTWVVAVRGSCMQSSSQACVVAWVWCANVFSSPRMMTTDRTSQFGNLIEWNFQWISMCLLLWITVNLKWNCCELRL